MREPKWAGYSDEQLLKLRFCDLKLTVEGTEVEPLARQLHGELERAGLIHFRPAVYFGDEWFSPDGVPAIAVPFYLAHPRLKALEKSIMLEVEGSTQAYCMKLLRHEAGHCFEHAYKIRKTRKWRELFGEPDEDYDPDSYRPRPYSRKHVVNLDNWYAQAHADEDFAETFAVWLDPHSNWRHRYRNWPVAFAKLQYVDSLVKRYAPMKPKVTKVEFTYNVNRLRTTLENFYARKRKDNAWDNPDFFDADLRVIFNGAADLSRKEAGAAEFLRANRRQIVNSVSYWTGEKKYTINSLTKKFIARCESLDLRVGSDPARTHFQVAAFLSALATHYLHTGQLSRSV